MRCQPDLNAAKSLYRFQEMKIHIILFQCLSLLARRATSSALRSQRHQSLVLYRPLLRQTRGRGLQ